jgi:5-methylcytosine-specific restriction enzyme B
MEYYNQLEQFLAQAKTDNLKTKHFESEFKETKVKVSFGQGNTAKIPWISFLKEPNTTSNGIYPVYLYYKDYDLLILAYGISETNKPQKKWDIRNKETINDFFKNNFGEKPDRYGNSFVFKIYDLKQELYKQQVEKDLELILFEYTKINFDDFESDKKKLNGINSFDIQSFQKTCKTAGLVYTDTLITRFVSSLLTKPFVILTGLSGSGKTKLAQAFVQWICQEVSQYRIIPVGADWTNREPLLGYPNALKPEEYVKPDSGVIDLILKALANPDLPHFLILDEMNLSHVERYFADFLSVMESKEAIPLYAEGTVENGVPAKLKVPANLFIIGTVNIDETTNMFSPKVLDRANTIEFRVSKNEMKSFLENIKDLNMDALISKGATMSKDFLDMAAKKSFATVDIEEINQILIKFFGELTKTGAEFGYRSATEILRLIHQLSEIDTGLTTNEKIDIGIMQKLLPKLHGSRRKLTPILETLGSFCVSKDLKIVKDVFEKQDFDFKTVEVLYPLSLEKITRMYKGAIDNGFASYAEA